MISRANFQTLNLLSSRAAQCFLNYCTWQQLFSVVVVLLVIVVLAPPPPCSRWAPEHAIVVVVIFVVVLVFLRVVRNPLPPSTQRRNEYDGDCHRYDPNDDGDDASLPLSSLSSSLLLLCRALLSNSSLISSSNVVTVHYSSPRIASNRPLPPSPLLSSLGLRRGPHSTSIMSEV